jgi:hypothetical protein
MLLDPRLNCRCHGDCQGRAKAGCDSAEIAPRYFDGASSSAMTPMRASADTRSWPKPSSLRTSQCLRQQPIIRAVHGNLDHNPILHADPVQHRNEVGGRCRRRIEVTAGNEWIVGCRADDVGMCFPRTGRNLDPPRSRSRTWRQTVANDAVEMKHDYCTFESRMKSTPALFATVSHATCYAFDVW